MILLARHGETDWNREGRWQGWADPPLNETAALRRASWLSSSARRAFDAVYSSDLSRARETAEIVAAPHGVHVVTDAGLREIDVGSWSGLTRAELAERFPSGDRPDGETRDQHRERVHAAVQRIARANLGRRILIVTHGGTMRALRGQVGDGPHIRSPIVE